jgi:hypothetical protein
LKEKAGSPRTLGHPALKPQPSAVQDRAFLFSRRGFFP